MNEISAKITSLIKRSVVTLGNDDTKAIAHAQISYLDKIAPTEVVYPYGYSASAPVGTIALTFVVNGNEANLATIPYSQNGRINNLKAGEVAIGSPSTGSYLKFNVNKSVTLETKEKLFVESASDINCNVTGDFNVVATRDVNFGATGRYNIFNGIRLTGAAASRILATNATNDLAATGLINWVHSTTLSITDDGIGGINIELIP
jgi:phage gp45-like